MSRSRVAVAAAFAVMLAGLTACVSPEEQHAEDEAVCKSYGFQPGTTDFASCLQRESLARRYANPPPDLYGPGWYAPYPGYWR